VAEYYNLKLIWKTISGIYDTVYNNTFNIFFCRFIELVA